MKLYAQFTDGVCTCVGTPNITGIEAVYDNLGQEYVDGKWQDVEEIDERVEETEEDLELKIANLQNELNEATEKLNTIQKGGGELELGKGQENK